MKDLQREILSQVAAGTISAEEAAARLEALEGSRPLPPAPPPIAAAAPVAPAPAAATTGARRVKVSSSFGAAEIVGDPSVAFAVAEGPHQARQEGDTMVIEHAAFSPADSFSFGDSSSRRAVIDGFDWQRRRLVVRMNPNLPLEASIQAGNVRIDGVTGPITGEIQAGNCMVSGFRGALDLVVQAGNVSATGRLDSGSSRVRCEMGSVRIALDRASSVRVKARTTLGKVAIDGQGGGSVVSGAKEVTIGAGAATLDLECTMGNLKVSVE